MAGGGLVKSIGAAAPEGAGSAGTEPETVIDVGSDAPTDEEGLVTSLLGSCNILFCKISSSINLFNK